MPALKAVITRIIEEGMPDWVECRFTDAAGIEHVIEEKIPVVLDAAMITEGAFPIPASLECVVRGVSSDGSMVDIDIARPWGLASTAGLTQFRVAADQVVPSGR